MNARMPMAVVVLALAAPARAAAPYAQDAAAVAAYFASSVTLTAAKVAVHDVEGAADVAGPATHALRAALLKLGVGVVRPEANPEYDLRGIVSGGYYEKVWLNSLWKRADGSLLATYDRKLGDPDAAPPVLVGATAVTPDVEPPPAARGRAWRVSAGANLRTRGISWMAGGLWASPSRRWEGALDFGFYSDRRTVYFKPSFPNQPAEAHHKIDIWHARAKASVLTPVADHDFLRGWIPRRWTLRAGTGLALVHTSDSAYVSGPTAVPPVDFPQTDTTYLKPLFEGGFRIPVSHRFDVDVAMEWIPSIIGPDDVNFTGLASSVRVVF